MPLWSGVQEPCSEEREDTVTENLPIVYRGFYDIPRAFATVYEGRIYLFDCPFDDEIDDYPETYSVFVLGPYADGWAERLDWAVIPKGLKPVGAIPTVEVRFDPTRRHYVDAAVFGLLDSVEPSKHLPGR